MKRTKRSWNVNQTVKSCFETFHYNERFEFKMAQEHTWGNKDAQIEHTIGQLRRYGDRLRNMLLGMALVDAMSWKDFIRLRTRVSRLVDEYVAEFIYITENMEW